MSFISFDDAKVRRFSETRNIFNPFSSKKCVSFDIHQAIVCEHNTIVCGNMSFLHFFTELFLKQKK